MNLDPQVYPKAYPSMVCILGCPCAPPRTCLWIYIDQAAPSSNMYPIAKAFLSPLKHSLHIFFAYFSLCEIFSFFGGTLYPQHGNYQTHFCIKTKSLQISSLSTEIYPLTKHNSMNNDRVSYPDNFPAFTHF